MLVVSTIDEEEEERMEMSIDWREWKWCNWKTRSTERSTGGLGWANGVWRHMQACCQRPGPPLFLPFRRALQ